MWPFSTSVLFRALRSKGWWLTKLSHTLFCVLRRFVQLLFISRYDVVVIHREVFPFLIPLFENWVTSRHPHVFFSFDDAVHIGHQNSAVLNHPLLYRMKYGAGINQVLRSSEGVIAGNRILAEHAREFNSNVVVVPTVVDTARFEYRSPKPQSQALTIGWMGSRSTVSYLRDLEPALRRIQSCFPDLIRFNFVGAPEYQPDLRNAASLPFRLDTEVADLQTFDIGLMPLPDTDWAKGKCAFKAIQYMAVGVPVIASPVGVTVDLIRHGSNGLLAKNSEDWLDALLSLIQDFDLRDRLSRAARRTIEERYSLHVWGPRFAEVFDTGRTPKVSLVETQSI